MSDNLLNTEAGTNGETAVNENIFSIIPYIHHGILQKLLHQPDNTDFYKIQPVRGAVIFFDIAGFTRLTMSLTSRGTAGTEILQELLEQYYTGLINELRKKGGIEYQFAGDSILAGIASSEEKSDEQGAWEAACCALEILENIETSYEIQNETFTIQTKIGLAYGNFFEILLGTEESFIVPAIVGRASREATSAERYAKGGEVIVSSRLWDLLPEEKSGEKRGAFYHLKEVKRTVVDSDYDYTLSSKNLNRDLLLRCAKFVAPSLYAKVTTGKAEFFGEFREVTSLFIRINGIDYLSDVNKGVANINSFFTFTQQLCLSLRGHLSQVDFSDKGDVIIAFFGAPIAQEGKEIMACQMALQLIEALPKFPFIDSLQVGISTGKNYCGNLGSKLRKGYSVIGESMNFAARLMTFREDNVIFMDEKTAEKTKELVDLLPVKDVLFKGIEKPASFFQVKGKKENKENKKQTYSNRLIGRKYELEELNSCMNSAMSGNGNIVLLLGEAGLGKTRIIYEFMNRLEGCQKLVGRSYMYEQSTSFHPWKEILSASFNIEKSQPDVVNVNKIRAALSSQEDLNPAWAVLLGTYLGLAIEEDQFTKELEPKQKHERLFQILLSFLEKSSYETPLVLVFEDVHWIDDISLDLVRYISQRLDKTKIMLLLSSRPSESIEAAMSEIKKSYILISELEENEAEELLKDQLALKKESAALTDMILHRARGNPFYIESIVFNLKEQGIIVKEDDNNYRLTVDNVDNLTIPHSLYDVVLSRIDKLSEVEQTILKTAAVVGRLFLWETIHYVLKNDFSTDVIRQSLDSLESLEFTPVESLNPKSYIFKHAVIREVAYETLLVKTRIRLHNGVASIMENKFKDNLNESADILAYHFLQGENYEKGFEYTLVAARRAANQFANKHAIHHYNKAIELLKTKLSSSDDFLLYQVNRELARVHLQAGNYDDSIQLLMEALKFYTHAEDLSEIHSFIGRAYQEKGDMAQAIEELETSLRLLKGRVPKHSVTVILSLLSQILKRGVPGGPRKSAKLPTEKEERYKKQIDTLHTLGKIYYFGDVEKLAWAGFFIANIADKFKDPYFKSLSYGMYTSILVGMGLRKKAHKFGELAVAEGKRSDNPLAKPIAFVRMGIYHLFVNDTKEVPVIIHQAATEFRNVGEMWELQTCLMLEATSYFLSGRLQEAEPLYLEMGELAKQLNALQHQGWSLAWGPFCRYLLSGANTEEIKKQIREGYQFSKKAGDIANQAVALMHLANIAVREGDIEAAAKLALETKNAIWDFKVVIPFVQCSLTDAAEAALFAVENGATSVSKTILLNVAKKCANRVILYGRIYPYLKGPGLRVKARYFAATGRKSKARRLFKHSIELMLKTPNLWETGVAFYDAGKFLNDQEYLGKAKQIFQSCGLQAEINRFNREISKDM